MKTGTMAIRDEKRESEKEDVCEDEFEPDSIDNDNGDVAVTDDTKPAPDHPVDKGWAWVVLGGCVFEIFIYGGMMRSFGVYFLQYQMRFNANASETAIMSLIQNVLISVTALFVMTVGLQKFTARTAVIVGGLLTGASYIITAFTTDIRVFYAAQGALSGIGMAMIHPPMLSIIGVYFHKHRGLANSIFMAGTSVGGLVFAPLIVNLFDEYGYSGAMLITGGLLLNICVAGCLLRPTEFYSKMKNNSELKLENVNELKLIKTGTMEVMSSDVNHSSETNNSHYSSGDNSDVADKDIAGTRSRQYLRINSYDPSLHNSSKHQGSPLLRRMEKDSSNSRIHIRHRTCSEGQYDGDEDLHGSKGKLKDVFETISRSQRNVYASDGMFGSFININNSINGTELTQVANHDDDNEVDIPKKGCCCSPKDCMLSVLCTMFDLQLLRNPVFIAFLLMAFMFIAGVALAPAYIPPLAKEIGISNENIAVILSLMAGLDLVSKITLGFVADRGWIKRSTMLTIIAFVFGTASHLVIFVKSFPVMIALAVIIGLCCGQYTSMYAVLLQDVTGPEKFAKSLGFGTVVHGTSIAIFFPIAGLIRDITSSYVATFHLFGSLAYVGGILVLIIPVINRRILARDRKKQKHVDVSPT